MSTYLEQLRDPRWQRKRLEVMDRANFTCEDCGATERTLNVHHKLYRRGAKPWEYEAHELACLCESCHERVTQTLANLKAIMAKLDGDELEQVLGYARALRAISFQHDDHADAPGFVTSASAFSGMEDACKLEDRHNPEFQLLCAGDTTETDFINVYFSILRERLDAQRRTLPAMVIVGMN